MTQTATILDQLRNRSIRNVAVAGKTVLLRVDFNVPLDASGNISDNNRIEQALPTIKYLIENGARLAIVTHLGRPKGFDPRFKVDVLAEELQKLLGMPVVKSDATVGPIAEEAIRNLDGTKICLLENVRFNEGESNNDEQFATALASLADVYVNDAFGVCHRKHASVYGVAHILDSYAGFLLENEIVHLESLIEDPKHPFTAVLGGSKVTDKILVIDKFLNIVDTILAGGGMCFNFLKVLGYEIGTSINDPEMAERCGEILEKAKLCKAKLVLPVDLIVAPSPDRTDLARIVPVEQIPADWMGLDIGPATVSKYSEIIAASQTIFWNGPMGLFEMKEYSNGTEAVARAIAESEATSIIGGGDTDAALKLYDLEDKVSFVSTGGGASLKMLEGVPMWGIEAILGR